MTLIDLLLQTDAVTPWFGERTGIYIGSFGGAGIGVLGGILGAVAGVFAPQGKGRGFVLGSMFGGAILGGLTLLTGLVALLLSQPYHVWYPMVMLGALVGGVFGGLTPLMRRRYMEAEQRRLDADALRRS
jgi:MFS family permease